MKHSARVVPGHLVNGTIGMASACGAAGGALFSLLTGAMASKWGIEILQPLCVIYLFFPNLSSIAIVSEISVHFLLFFFVRLLAMMIIMGILWTFVPKKSL
jgi:hypothetical protein